MNLGAQAIRRVGFIGLGHMGAGMCVNLVRAGFEVTAYDIDAAALARVVQPGARPAASAQECARGAEALITMLPAPPHVERAWLAGDGALAGLEPGALAIDMSTSSLALGKRLAEAAAERGVDVLDAPVAGSPTRAAAGTLGIYIGGPEAAYTRARPLFAAMGEEGRIFYLGPAGAGYAVKLLLNLMWFIESVATGEVLSMGVLAGVPLDRLYAALVGSPANSTFLEEDVRSVLDAGDYSDVFPMRLVTKDLGLAVDLAREVGMATELTALVEQIHRRARRAYGDDAGQISAIRLYEDLAGIRLRLEPGT
jgi:3-hydroxyisobutyrate dehydrogenase